MVVMVVMVVAVADRVAVSGFLGTNHAQGHDRGGHQQGQFLDHLCLCVCIGVLVEYASKKAV